MPCPGPYQELQDKHPNMGVRAEVILEAGLSSSGLLPTYPLPVPAVRGLPVPWSADQRGILPAAERGHPDEGPRAGHSCHVSLLAKHALGVRRDGTHRRWQK